MILCCGEALIDLIPASTVDKQSAFTPHAGGAVFNTAIALGRLGIHTAMITGLSTDLFGRQLSAALRASHVDVTHVIMSDRPSTLAFVELNSGHASYSFFDENSAGRMITSNDLPTLSDKIKAFFFGGISLACQPGAEAYATLAEREANNRVVILDPNIRPGFIDDIQAYRCRLERILALTDIVKVSDEDLNWIFPGSESLPEKISRIRKLGPSVVILTRGGDGATAFLRDGSEVSVAARKVSVVDTVGAGDTFNAGVIAKLSEMGLLSKEDVPNIDEEKMKNALEYGAIVAAVTVSRAGANPPWREELGEKLF